MNDAFIELDGAWRPIREAFVERYGAWAPERLRLVGHDGQWVEAYDAEPVTAKDIVDVERLSYRAGAPLQGELELFGRGLDATALPDPPVGAFYPLASNLSDRLENFSSLVSHGTEAPMPSIVDGAGAYVFDAAKQQYVSLPLSINSASAYYDLLGFMGNDGASSDERGKKHWELGCKFRAVSLPAPGQVQFVVFAGTATQNIAVGFDSAGTLFAQFVNGAYAKKLEIPGVVAVGAWVGFVYRHRPSGAARFLELQAHTGAAVSVQGDVLRTVAGTTYHEFAYWVPPPDQPINMGYGVAAWAPAEVYTSGAYRDLFARNAPMSPARTAMVIAPEVVFEVLFTHKDSGSAHVANAYLLKKESARLILSVPELLDGDYLVSCRYVGAEESNKKLFTVRAFQSRTTPLHVDFASDTVEHIRSELMIAHKQWGGANGGVSSENVVLDRANGVCEITALGDLYSGPVLGVDRNGDPSGFNTRIGGCIVTRDYFGPGSYRILCKPAPLPGVCSALWTFHYEEGYPGSPLYEQHLQDGLHPAGNEVDGLYTVRNHEIDIEFPTALKSNPNQEDVSPLNARFNTWRGELRNWNVPNPDVPTGDPMYSPTPDPAYWSEYTDDFVSHGVNLADGAFHEMRFDWHLGADPRVEFYIDGVLKHTVRTHIPDIPGRYWAGMWFPSGSTHWAGRGAPWFMQHMLIKELTITPFPDESGFERRIVETYPNDVFRDFKPPGY